LQRINVSKNKDKSKTVENSTTEKKNPKGKHKTETHKTETKKEGVLKNTRSCTTRKIYYKKNHETNALASPSQESMQMKKEN